MIYFPNISSGDIDGDGKPEIIFETNNDTYGYGLVVYNSDWTLKWDNTAQVRAWANAHPPSNGKYFIPTISQTNVTAIADLKGDGNKEIISGPTVINADGSVRCAGYNSYSGSGKGYFHVYGGVLSGFTAVVDLNLDGQQEIVAGNAAYDNNCNLLWLKPSLPDGAVAIANFDGDPYPEIVLEGFVSGDAAVYLLDHAGNIKWGPVSVRQLLGNNSIGSFAASPPIVADFDGDGKPEIGIRSENKILILNKDGQLKNTLTIPGYTGAAFSAAPTVFDLDGDGIPEVMINSGGYFTILSGKDGTVLYQDPFGGFDNVFPQNVTVADVDGDGQVELVVTGHDDKNILEAMRVYHSADPNHPWSNGRRIYNQTSYHVTNVNDDGSIPQHEAPSWLLNNSYQTQAAVGRNPNPYLTPNPTASLLRTTQTGTSISMTVRVGNGGAVPAPSGVNVMFYDGDPTASGVVIGTTATTKILQPGDYQDIVYSTNTLSLGLHHIYAVVNSGPTAIAECRTDDNQTSMNFTVQQGQADLKVGPEDIVLPLAPYYEGSIIPITAGVRNQGSVAASNVTVKLFLGSPSAGGVQIGATQTISNLAAGAFSPLTFSFDTLGKAGTNVLYIVLDQENAVTESDKTNNIAGVTVNVQISQLPNLTITSGDIQLSPATAQQGQAVTITAVVTNRGTTVGNIPVRMSVRSGELGDGSEVYSETKTIYPVLSLGQTATVTATLDTAGLFGQQTVFVSIDPTNTIIESTKIDNTASIPLFIQSAGLSSIVSLDKTTYQPNETVNAAVTVSNTTAQPRNLSLNLSVIDSAGNNIAVISITDPVTVFPNSSVQLSRTWNIGSTLAGNYILATELTEGTEKRVISKANANFVITSDKSVEAKVVVDKISYQPNSIAMVTSTITSKSANYIFENLTARMTIAGSGGQGAVYTDTKSITTLMPGAGYTFKTYWSIATNPSGTYPVTLEVRDATNAVIATGTQNLVITSNANTSALLRGQIALDRQVLLSGETATINYTVTNVGNTDLTGVTIFIKTVSVDEQTVYDTLTDTISLVKGASFTNTKLINTGKYGAKDYLVVLQADINGTAATLAGTYLRIEGAPTAPSLNAPADGTDVLTFTPDLIVNNASDPNDDKISYQFELYSDSGLAKLEATSGQLTEGTGTTTWTIPYSLTENQTYYWRARAFDGWLYGPWSTTASFRVNTVNEPPTAPVLLSPVDNGIVSALTPTLTITNATDPDSPSLTYNFDMALDPDFTQIIATTTGVSSQESGVTSWTVPINLIENQTYYWRAQADDWLIIGPWSATSKFFVNTVNTAPTAPVIIAPINNAIITSLTPTITIQNSTDPDSPVITYFFEADAVTTFDSNSVLRSGPVAQGQGATVWTMQGLKDNTHYFVRSKANDGQADSPWSGVITFFANTVNDPPTAPAIANPSNGSGVNTTTPTLSVQNATDPDGDVLTYELALYADSGMTSLVTSMSGVSSQESGVTSWTIPITLLENQNYYWRARAFDGQAYGSWSILATFMVNAANHGPGAPIILSPLDNGSVTTLNPVLTVGNATNPGNAVLLYSFEVYKDGTLVVNQSGVSSQVSGATSWTITTPLADNTVYQWRSRAFDGDRYGPWTPLATFTVHLAHTSITVDIEFEPETLNKNSHGQWVLVEIELPHGYNAKDVDISSIRLEGTVPAELWPYEHHNHHHEHGCDHDRRGHDHDSLMVKFRRSDVIAVLPTGNHVTVHVTGKVGTTLFEGVDVIRVK